MADLEEPLRRGLIVTGPPVTEAEIVRAERGFSVYDPGLAIDPQVEAATFESTERSDL